LIPDSSRVVVLLATTESTRFLVNVPIPHSRGVYVPINTIFILAKLLFVTPFFFARSDINSIVADIFQGIFKGGERMKNS